MATNYSSLTKSEKIQMFLEIAQECKSEFPEMDFDEIIENAKKQAYHIEREQLIKDIKEVGESNNWKGVIGQYFNKEQRNAIQFHFGYGALECTLTQAKSILNL